MSLGTSGSAPHETADEPQVGDAATGRSKPTSVSAPRNGPLRPAPPRSKSAAKPKKAKQFWLKQLHSWHWISAAISLSGMFVFAIPGITLNHASSIAAEPIVVTQSAQLPGSLIEYLRRGPEAGSAPLPAAVRAELEDAVGIDAGTAAAEWSETEVYVAVPGPGSDAWISIDRASGKIEAERTDRGWVSFFNDLHKGRNTGTAWFWLIDILAVACVVFTFTGLLLLQLHARHRPSTWPLVGLGTAIPLIIILFFMHL
ncbi:MAG: hypothetical protein CL680_12430 [Blastomonas sp.]|nr:hypothetical protein [Blastomonas sp.]